MAKIIAPLLSLDASGTIASALVFGKYKGRQIAKRKRVSVAPTDPKTPAQLFNRDYFSVVVSIWKLLDNETKTVLDNLGNSVSYSGFNWYVKAYLKRRPTECGNIRCGFSELGDLTF